MSTKRLPIVELDAPVAVTIGSERNVLAVPLRAVHGVAVDDARFELGSSFVVPGSSNTFAEIASAHQRHPAARFSLFGHVDPREDGRHGRALAERRARAVTAVLLRDLAAWEELYSRPLGADDWSRRPLQIMLEWLGFDPGVQDGRPADDTRSAVAAFQESHGLPRTGASNPGTRSKLFEAYMDRLCRGVDGVPFRLQETSFLGVPGDPDRTGAFQGCAAFNPRVVRSRAEVREDRPVDKANRRAVRHAANRRVDVFLVSPGVELVPSQWPCTRAAAGVDGCKARFWSDGEARLRPGHEVRWQVRTQDTYACRFFERLSMSVLHGEPAPAGRRLLPSWSRTDVQIDNNGARRQPVAAVELLVDTVGILDGARARIEIRHAVSRARVPGGVVEGLEVRDDQVVDAATGQPATWSFDASHDPWAVWDRPFFYFTVEVETLGEVFRAETPHDLAQPDALLRVKTHFVLVADELADRRDRLTTCDETEEIGALAALSSAHFALRFATSTPAVVLETWAGAIRNSYAYLQSSHGTVECLADGWIFDYHRGTGLPTHCYKSRGHSQGRSVFCTGDSNVGASEVADTARVPSVPRYLAYFSTCLTGHEPSCAEAFLARGTQNVIAFRRVVFDVDAREMDRRFHRKWLQVHRADPGKIADVFYAVAAPFWADLMPVLFGRGAARDAGDADAIADALGVYA